MGMLPDNTSTIQRMAQQRANQYRMDQSKPNEAAYDPSDPYGAAIRREQSILDDPGGAPGTEGFRRELQTQGNVATEKLRSRIAGVADPLAVGREMARLDGQVRNQLAVYLAQRQQQAQTALSAAEAGRANYNLQQQQLAQQREFQQQQLEQQRQQSDRDYKLSRNSTIASGLLGLGKLGLSLYQGNLAGAAVSAGQLFDDIFD